MCIVVRMTDDAKALRLRTAREKAGYEKAIDAVRAFGWPQSTYLGHENGSRGFKDDAAKKYARAFKVSPEWLAFGRGQINRRTLRIGGEVGAGAVVLPFDADQNDWTRGSIEGPPDLLGDALPLVIRGDSQSPVYQDGDIVIIDGAVSANEADGAECVVELADGRKLLKMVHLQTNGLVTLESYNARIMMDQAVEAFHPVAWVKRARRKHND